MIVSLSLLGFKWTLECVDCLSPRFLSLKIVLSHLYGSQAIELGDFNAHVCGM